MIYLEIKKMNNYDFLESLDSIEKILENNNFDVFIIFAIKNNKVKLLELLKKMPDYDLIESIKKLYPNINVNINLKISKLVNEIKDKI